MDTPEADTYAVRRNAFEAERVWRIDPSGLSWEAADKSGRFAFDEIGEVRLEWAATRADHARYACHVVRFNGWTETIVSTHYDGIARFGDRAASFNPFVRRLVAEIARANPQCRFRAGATGLAYFGSLALMIGAALLLATVIAAFGIPLHVIIVAKLVVIAALTPLAIAWSKRNRPRPFDPRSIPEEVLPSPLTAS